MMRARGTMLRCGGSRGNVRGGSPGGFRGRSPGGLRAGSGRLFGGCLVAWLGLLAVQPCAAARARPQAAAPARQQAAPARPQAAGGAFTPEAPYRAALLMDRDSGEVLFAKNEHLRWPPASMAKMMTLLIAMEQVQAGSLALDDVITASAWASKIGGSQVYLREGEQFPLRELLKAIVIAGSTAAFVDLMNQRARELELGDSEFHSVHGLPPSPGQEPDLMSAMDLAILGRRLAAFPQIVEWAAMSDAPFRDGQLAMRNTNHLVRTYPGADGLKTGFYAAAGFEVTATATRDGLRLLAVVLGAPAKRGCFDEAARLLSSGFAGYRVVQPAKAGQPAGGAIAVASGTVASFTGVAARDLRFTLPRSEAAAVKVEVRVPPRIVAPVKKGQVVGEILATRGDKQLGRVEIVAPEDVDSTSWWSKWF
jgi:D-alanyl-D-alanine carboxypeptidase (penicillin-binding protein 5/6)